MEKDIGMKIGYQNLKKKTGLLANKIVELSKENKKLKIFIDIYLKRIDELTKENKILLDDFITKLNKKE